MSPADNAAKVLVRAAALDRKADRQKTRPTA
jgi:hypothetical protein